MVNLEVSNEKEICVACEIPNLCSGMCRIPLWILLILCAFTCICIAYFKYFLKEEVSPIKFDLKGMGWFMGNLECVYTRGGSSDEEKGKGDYRQHSH
jgi:hypothetical protein